MKICVNSISLSKLAEHITKEEDKFQLMKEPDKLKKHILDDFTMKCPQDPPRKDFSLDYTYEAIRVLRNKRVAHLENHDLVGLEKTNWIGIKDLIAFCKTFINIVNYGFLGHSKNSTVHGSDLKLDEGQSGISISNIIKELKL